MPTENADFKILLREAEEIRDMMNLPAWKTYTRTLEAKLKEKEREALRPMMPEQLTLDGIAIAMFGEAAKGAIIGIRLALDLPSAIVAGADNLRSQIAARQPSADKEKSP